MVAGKVTTRRLILSINKAGLKHYESDRYWSYHTPILQVAYNLGHRGIDLSIQPDVIGWRAGKSPQCGISTNYRENISEYGLSMLYINDEPICPSMIWFAERKRYEYKGLLLPYLGSDDEPLILPYGFEVMDD